MPTARRSFRHPASRTPRFDTTNMELAKHLAVMALANLMGIVSPDGSTIAESALEDRLREHGVLHDWFEVRSEMGILSEDEEEFQQECIARNRRFLYRVAEARNLVPELRKLQGGSLIVSKHGVLGPRDIEKAREREDSRSNGLLV